MTKIVVPRLGNLPASVQEAFAPLSVAQRRFVVAYCGEANGIGVLACKLAGIGGSYSNRAAKASQMLRDPKVMAARDAWMAAYAMTKAEVTAQFADLARANLGPFVRVNADGSLAIKMDEDTWEAHKHWIKSVECDPDTGAVTRLVLHDALAARREIAKILKLYSDAPQLNMFLYLQSLPDDEILRRLQEEEARAVALLGPGSVSEDNE